MTFSMSITPVQITDPRSADGQIEWANMTRYGVLYLGVWSRYDNRPFDCTVDVQRRRYHCQSH